jgi:hypothetical protein
LSAGRSPLCTSELYRAAAHDSRLRHMVLLRPRRAERSLREATLLRSEPDHIRRSGLAAQEGR